MSKSETSTDTGTAGEPDAWTDKELEAVAGGDPSTAAGLQFFSWLLQHSGYRLPPRPPAP